MRQPDLHKAGDAFAPRWLDQRAVPVITAIVDAYTASLGRSRRHLAARLGQVDSGGLDEPAFRSAVFAVDAWHDDVPGGKLDPREVRRRLFREGAREGGPEGARWRTAHALGVTVEAVNEALFADLPPERLLRRQGEVPGAGALILAANQLLLESALVMSSRLDIDLTGNTRGLVHAIRATRLIALVETRDTGTLHLSLSGPLSLHTQTRLYGRALCRFVRAVQRSERWSIHAQRTSSAGRSEVCVVNHRDPLPKPGGSQERFDSHSELALYDGLLRHGGAWQITREPAPLRVGDGWFFPDFLATHAETDLAVWIELVGFWTPAYVARKRELMSRSHGHPVLYLIDEKLGLDASALVADAVVLLFRGRCAAKAVVAALDRLAVQLRENATGAPAGHDRDKVGR